MTVLTQADLATQMVRQLRILDPSVSGEVGTPERKIIDTVAQALSDAQLDLSVLDSSLDLDTKFGDTLDQFVNLFGFGRQQGTAAIGIVEFSRITASNFDIVIPINTQVSAIQTDGTPQAIFSTTQDATLPAGELAVDVPVRSINVGALNNVAANTLTSFGGTPVQGITNVTNPIPTSGGANVESDTELKIRFKNTLFRNLAGTSDQYLALAVAGAFTNKANVVGPVSRYREYVQVPTTDDSNFGGGEADEYTTALSTIPYSQHYYGNLPAFVSNGLTGISTVFYTQDIDYRVNINGDDKYIGDTLRESALGIGYNPITNPKAANEPNVTFLNVYAADDGQVSAVRPGDVVLFEHSYLSSASRNDYDRAVTNCVDIFINSSNSVPATTVIPAPTVSSVPFQDNPNHRYHFGHYRRLGEPEHRPQLGNIFTPLFWTPITSLPTQLVVDNVVYVQGQHYWPVIDVSSSGGTVRAKTGIEWSIDRKGLVSGAPTGARITSTAATSIEIPNYTFDKNVIDIQASVEGGKQVTTDVLVHKAVERYFKFDITVMYVPGVSTSATNQAIAFSVDEFLENTYFGSAIQLSDVLQSIHNTPGVDNVRWTYDVDTTKPKVTETDINGNPRLGGVVDRFTSGDGSTQEVKSYYITGGPTGGTYKIKVGTSLSNAIAYNAGLGAVTTGLAPIIGTVTAPGGLNATANGTPSNPFFLEFVANGDQTPANPVSIVPSFTCGTGGSLGCTTSFNNDFFLNDNELATLPEATATGDSVPGFIIRPRAQNTWTR